LFPSIFRFIDPLIHLSFDVKVLGGFPIPAFFFARTRCFADRPVRFDYRRLRLLTPSYIDAFLPTQVKKFTAFLWTLNPAVSQGLKANTDALVRRKSAPSPES
jgi:hypothetical protein